MHSPLSPPSSLFTASSTHPSNPIIQWLGPLLSERELWTSSNSGISSATQRWIMQSEIQRSTDCQEGAELKAAADVCVSLCVDTHTHALIWWTVYDSSNVPKSSNSHRGSFKPSINPFNLQTGDTERPWLCHYHTLFSWHVDMSHCSSYTAQ